MGESKGNIDNPAKQEYSLSKKRKQLQTKQERKQDMVDEEIRAKTQIVVDGDLSPERMRSLTELGREEERLDYKKFLDISSKSAQKRAKVELVCDLVSMANTV